MRVELRSDLPECKECGAGELLHTAETNRDWKDEFLSAEADATAAHALAHIAAVKVAERAYEQAMMDADCQYENAVSEAMARYRRSVSDESIAAAARAFHGHIEVIAADVPRFRFLKRRWITALAAQVDGIEGEIAEASRR